MWKRSARGRYNCQLNRLESVYIFVGLKDKLNMDRMCRVISIFLRQNDQHFFIVYSRDLSFDVAVLKICCERAEFFIL